MIVKGTYFQNSAEQPLAYGDVEITNVKRQRLRGEEPKEGILCEPVMVGFCGPDAAYEFYEDAGDGYGYERGEYTCRIVRNDNK